MIGPNEILNGKILIVDDLEVNVRLLERILGVAGYLAVSSTTSPMEVCRLHFENHYDLILLDLKMPGMDGFQVLEALGSCDRDGHVPVLVVTAQPDRQTHAFDVGARDFISKPFKLAELLARVHDMLAVRLLQNELRQSDALLRRRVQERTAELREGYLRTIYTLMGAAEQGGEETAAHLQRISHLSRELSRAVGMGVGFAEEMFFASPMHDIGKIGIPEEILRQRGRLSPEQWQITKAHTALGARILGESESPWLEMAVEIALHHHEHWDGGGYPQGRRGEEIPLAARIMSICDVYDALRSARSYKPAFDHATAMNVITRGDGRVQPGHFDPAILDAFQENHASFGEIFGSFPKEQDEVCGPGCA